MLAVPRSPLNVISLQVMEVKIHSPHFGVKIIEDDVHLIADALMLAYRKSKAAHRVSSVAVDWKSFHHCSTRNHCLGKKMT